MTTIGISGSYGGLNLGDEAILTSAIAQLRATVPGVEIVVFSRDAEHTRRHHDAERVLNPRSALRDEIVPEIERLDVLLLGGGGILYDTEARTYLREVVIAQSLGIPTIAYAIGIGPLDDPHERRAVRHGLNRMTGITVREIGAKRLLEEIGITVPVEVTGDPALLLNPGPGSFEGDVLARLGAPTDRPLVGMSVREPGAAAPSLGGSSYHRMVAEAADFMVTRFDADVLFVPMERCDVNEIHRVLAEMHAPGRGHVLRWGHGPREVLALMSRLQLAIGMRLHFLIFAALADVPFMALPYASKVHDFLDSLGMGTDGGFQDRRTGVLLADLDRLWDHRDEFRARVGARLPILQDRARRTAPIVRDLLRPQPFAHSEPDERPDAAAHSLL